VKREPSAPRPPLTRIKEKSEKVTRRIMGRIAAVIARDGALSKPEIQPALSGENPFTDISLLT
jgi:hypothetical protein